MGQRGPVGKPAELKALEGGRGNRPISLDQVFRPEVGAPPMPKDLSREARKAWKRLVPELLRYNLLSKVDADALEQLCETIAELRLQRRAINKRRELLISQDKDPAEASWGTTPNGMKVQSVGYQIINREMEKLRYWLAAFGLSPAERARVTTAIRAQLQLFEGGAPKGDGPGAGGEPRGFAEFD